MFKQLIEQDLKSVVKELGFIPSDIVVSISENSSFGDYSSNIALQLSKQNTQNSYQNQQEIANAIIEKLGHPVYVERIEVAGAGFINFFLKDESLVKSLDQTSPKKISTRKILVEYGQPNTHKEFHIGHLRTLLIGESIARVLESQGVEVFRACYGSDIGLPVAKSVWGVIQLKDDYEAVKAQSLKQKAEFLGKAYAFAHEKYESSPEIKQEIDQINTKIYARDPEFMPLWEETKKWSLGYFDTVFSRLGVEFDRDIRESEIEEEGKGLVLENVGKVFVEDQGAIIFPGEKYGLYNSVFVTSKGYPTYEGKELGLTSLEEGLFPFDQSIHVVDSQQTEFFRTVIKALELIDSSYKNKKQHLSYGFVALTTGRMSSRKGNVISGEFLIDQVVEAMREVFPEKEPRIVEKVAIAAVKFFYLKFSHSSDITFDIAQSISLQGDTGVYVMYTYVRTQSLLQKAEGSASGSKVDQKVSAVEEEEREVLRQLEYFDIFVEHAYQELSPNHIASYLLNLSRTFSSFYEKYPIIGSTSQDFRLKLVSRVGETLKKGLYLLGIETVERM